MLESNFGQTPASPANTQPYAYDYEATAPGHYSMTEPTASASNNPSKKKSANWPFIGGLIALLVVVSFIAGLFLSTLGVVAPANRQAGLQPASAAPVSGGNPTTNQVAPLGASSGQLLTVQQIAERVRPAIVQITSQQNVGLDTTNPFFGSQSGSGADSQTSGVGSGVIYDKEGYILTNFHVIEGADSLLVTLPDGRLFEAKVVGSDRQTDLAVIKVDPAGQTLPLAELGDSSSLKVGDGLVAIGNALALPGGPTVTAGVVSALDRSVTEPGTNSGRSYTPGPQLYGLIQTDAAINPGNSGGALVDMQGRVIGINTLVAGQSEAGVPAQGIGFAISINQAKEISQQLVANGKVSHAFMGISYQPLTPALATQLKLDSSLSKKTGAVITQVQAGSPAAKAGLKKGDVITAIEGQALKGESSLGQIINSRKAGDTVSLDVASADGSRTVQITLGERPQQ